MATFRAIWVAVALLAAAACTGVATPSAAPSTPVSSDQPTAVAHTLTIDELANVLANEANAYTIVNVHIPHEGEIDGTDLRIAYNDIDALMTALPDKNVPIIVYCRSGNMSAQATTVLVERGYSQVYDVPGGMIAWEASGRQIVD
ncbi:MAG: rhodanese-like domain-containing protein [Anaerolineae bacterium]|nr:rhodanese-like domain-containing protein [Anaerolineae bacterium]